MACDTILAATQRIGNVLVLFHCLHCYQDDVTCQSIFVHCSKGVSHSAGIMNLWMKAFYHAFLITYTYTGRANKK